MSLSGNVSSLAARIASEINTVRSEMGEPGTHVAPTPPTPASGESVLWVRTVAGAPADLILVTGD